MPESIDYKAAGVDLDTYEQTMAQLPPLLKRTFTPRVIEWKDGFAGLFRLDANIGLMSRTYRDPVLVASTDLQDGAGLPAEYLGYLIPSGLRVVVAKHPNA